MKRREFITLLGAAGAVWPLAARAQQPMVPVIGFLRSTAAAGSVHVVAAFRQGFSEAGFIDGQTSPSSIAGPTDNTTGCLRW